MISQDSDCFAYGARRVYRNFSVSSAAGGGAMQGSVDCYDATKMLHANGSSINLCGLSTSTDIKRISSIQFILSIVTILSNSGISQ